MSDQMSTTVNELKNIPAGKTEAININEVVKQGSIFGPVIQCASTSKVNNINEEIQYNCGNWTI